MMSHKLRATLGAHITKHKYENLKSTHELNRTRLRSQDPLTRDAVWLANFSTGSFKTFASICMGSSELLKLNCLKSSERVKPVLSLMLEVTYKH